MAKYKFPIFVFIISSILIIFSLYFTVNQNRENAEYYEKLVERKWSLIAEEKNYLMGKFDQTTRADFTLIPSQYVTPGADAMYLRNETLSAFFKMEIAAEKDGLELNIASATRNFTYQKALWNDKWTGATLVDGKDLSKTIPDGLTRFKKILEYSAIPGTSRHHWGTDIDINNVNPPYFNSPKGQKEYAWLVKNASAFGFCQPYNLKNDARLEGYNEEKWHWTYLPLARNFTTEYEKLISDKDLKGFLGDSYLVGQNLIKNQVLGINPGCI